jgi:ABC-type amino acid transport substrate-binding protein
MFRSVCFLLLAFLFHPSTGQPDTLRIAVYDSPPFGMVDEHGNYGGLMVELWEDIANEMNIVNSYFLTDMDGVIGGLQSNTYDVGMGAISITPAREQLIDFSHAVNPSGTGIAVSRKDNKQSFWKKWRPIFINLLELIGSLFVMLLLSAFIVYAVEKRYNRNNKTDRSILSITDGIWWSAVTMTTVGYGDKVPSSNFGRILGIFWIFVSIIFFSLFTANTSAQLINYQLVSDISTLDDLRCARVVAVASSSGEEYLKREKVAYEAKPTLEEAIGAVLNGESDAIVSNVPVLKYRNKMYHKGQLLISENLLLRNNMGFAFHENNQLREQVNLILLEKIAEPKWQMAVHKYLEDGS